MNRLLVMTIIGQDRPGLVESVAALVAKHDGNWLESRMSRLGGHFAGILRVEAPAPSADPLIHALQGLSGQGLTIVIHADKPAPEGAPARLSRLEIVGHDRPGIVSQISHVLAEHGVNVEELETERTSAAMSGELLFRARAKLSLPASCDSSRVQKELERLAEDLIVDISLAELTEAETK